MVNVEPVQMLFTNVWGKKGHSTERCYRRDKTPKNEWYINRIKQQQQGMEYNPIRLTTIMPRLPHSTTFNQRPDYRSATMTATM
jgi:hypothetical protein